ncbi:AraC family transcriptional regulator [Anaerosporobacter sp.]|uniref:AraC family transcriptional regulator n=1 Tax=Anaerosporobacter sp. TaxID=1872529 RepID=UPI00286EFA17|nr:AraC family transcriptional regulator [Anaerosporobacter sp.]
MTFELFETQIYELNEDEKFYRSYYYARQQEYSLKKFLANIDLGEVKKRNLLIPELAETIPPRMEDSYVFTAKDQKDIAVQKHNRFSPALEHSHTFFELLFVYDGKCSQKINGKEMNLRDGDLCIIPPGSRHTVEVFDESICINVFIRKSTLQNIFFNFLRTSNVLSMFFLNNIYSQNANDYIIFHSGPDIHAHIAMLRTLWEFTEQDDYYYSLIVNTINNLFAILLRYYSESVEMPTFIEKSDVQRFALLQFIQSNYTNITLEEIAERFHYTPEYTSKLIKKTTGHTFTHILQSIRIERAQILLQDTNMTVSNIANQVGYDTTEHFIRTFKKLLHMTPTQYRQSNIRI